MAAGGGSVIQSVLCAPARTGEMNGPSRCTPSTRAPAGPASRPVRGQISGHAGGLPQRGGEPRNGAVMNVGTKAGVPVSGSRAATIRHSPARTASNSPP